MSDGILPVIAARRGSRQPDMAGRVRPNEFGERAEQLLGLVERAGLDESMTAGDDLAETQRLLGRKPRLLPCQRGPRFLQARRDRAQNGSNAGLPTGIPAGAVRRGRGRGLRVWLAPLLAAMLALSADRPATATPGDRGAAHFGDHRILQRQETPY